MIIAADFFFFTDFAADLQYIYSRFELQFGESFLSLLCSRSSIFHRERKRKLVVFVAGFLQLCFPMFGLLTLGCSSFHSNASPASTPENGGL